MSYEGYKSDEIVVGQSILFMNLKVVISIELEIEEIRCSGKELEKEAKFLKNDDAGMVKMIPTKPMVVETFAEYPTVGRFTMRDMRQTFDVSVDKKDPTGANKQDT
ncbi:hypothetical protein MTR67_020921 [Solanum verrucosum]|uniref:GTP-eEF1A C-terminal domain-containing protein n=1 Tax=Solanum verrucosum TaxID=315347 RepID=A0AAF0QVW9_SOLVR|nr:hypothetical protein MTR67_020921 [Solanum verrucosum]